VLRVIVSINEITDTVIIDTLIIDTDWPRRWSS